MKHFPLDKNYAVLLKSYGISVDELLKKAKLPLDIFVRNNPCVTSKEYYRFMKAIEELVPDKKMPILLATADNIETITPPILGAYCSSNAKECIKRIAQYKALAGAITFEVYEQNEHEITVEIKGDENIELPEIIVGIEMVLLTNLIRKATKSCKGITCKELYSKYTAIIRRYCISSWVPRPKFVFQGILHLDRKISYSIQAGNFFIESLLFYSIENYL